MCSPYCFTSPTDLYLIQRNVHKFDNDNLINRLKMEDLEDMISNGNIVTIICVNRDKSIISVCSLASKIEEVKPDNLYGDGSEALWLLSFVTFFF